VATSTFPRIALAPELTVYNDRAWIDWRTPIDVFLGDYGDVRLDRLGGELAIDPLDGRLVVQHRHNRGIGTVARMISLSGLHVAPTRDDPAFSLRCTLAAVQWAKAWLSNAQLTLRYYTLTGEWHSWTKAITTTTTVGQLIDWINGIGSGSPNNHVATLASGASRDWLASGLADFSGEDSLPGITVMPGGDIGGHAKGGTLESITTVELGGSIIVFNTDSVCAAARAFPGPPEPPGLRSRARCNLDDATGCPETPWNYEGICQDSTGEFPCISCKQTTKNLRSPCRIKYGGLMSNYQEICNPTGDAGRGINPIWGLRVKPVADRPPLDMDLRSWHTQAGEFEPGQRIPLGIAQARHAGGHAKFFCGSFRVLVCPCHEQDHCPGAPSSPHWLCHWRVTNDARYWALECNGVWSKDRWISDPNDPDGSYDDPPGSHDPRHEHDRRPIEVYTDSRRQIIYVDCSLHGSACFPLLNAYCFTAGSPFYAEDQWSHIRIWGSIGNSRRIRVVALQWLACELLELRMTYEYGQGTRYPHHTPQTMERRNDVLAAYESAFDDITNPGKRIYLMHYPPNETNPLGYQDPGLNRWESLEEDLGLTVVRRDGDDAGEPIELTVFAHYSGIEFPARLELTTARLTMYLNVERYHRYIGAQAPPGYSRLFGHRLGATADLVLSCRVRLQPEAYQVEGLTFLCPTDRYDLRFEDPDNPGAEHPTEFAVVKGPNGERVPLVVRWRGCRGPWPYAKGWDPRYNVDPAAGAICTRGFEFRPSPETCPEAERGCCYAAHVIHGASIWSGIDYHGAEIPDSYDDPIEWGEQLCEGRMVIWIPVLPIPGVPGTGKLYNMPSYDCECD